MAVYVGKVSKKNTDPRINYNLCEGEVLMTCPYNPSHAVRELKFPKHVLNCHRLHVIEQAKIGQAPLFGICKHDRSHHMRLEELEAHEEECPARPMPVVEEENPHGIVVKLDKPPEVDAAALAVIQEENWEDEPAYERNFDADAEVRKCRERGYNVIQAHKVVGLTKSEKKAFYKADAEEMRKYQDKAMVRFLKEEPNARGYAPSTSSRSSAIPSVVVPRATTRSAVSTTPSESSTVFSERGSDRSAPAAYDDLYMDDGVDEEYNQ